MRYYKIVLTAVLLLVTCLFCTDNSNQKDRRWLNFVQHDNSLTEIDIEDSFKWPEGKKMGLSLTFDDARLSQIDKGIPLFDKYNVKGTFYVSLENMFERTDKWRQAAANGHEIGNHTLSHPCTGNFAWTGEHDLESYTLEQMEEDIKTAGNIIRDSLGIEAMSFAYPCGQSFVGRGVDTKSYIPLVASLFDTGRGWLDEGPNDPLFCDMAQLMGMELDGKSFKEVRQLIESAKKTGKWLILVGHEMDRKGEQTSLLSTLEAICKYAMDPSNEIWIDNVHSIASYILEKRNEMSFQDTQTN